MRKCLATAFRWGLGIGFGFSAILGAQSPKRQVRETVRVPFSSVSPRIDGQRDRCWEKAVVCRLDQKEQLLPGTLLDWKGPRDSSLEVRVLHDGMHLFFFIRIRDQGPLAPKLGESWESGDVLEFFFDTDLRDGGEGNTQFNEDDLQFLVMPFGVERDWGLVDFDLQDQARLGKTHIVDRGFSGLQLVRRRTPEGGIVELSLPLVDLPEFKAGTREIGFNIAYGDRDPGRKVYQYLVWSGGRPPYRNTANLGRLQFLGPPPLSSNEESSPFMTGSWLQSLPFLLPGVLLFGMLWVARSVTKRLLERGPRTKRTFVISVIGMVLLALLWPSIAQYLRANQFQEKAHQAMKLATGLLRQLEEGALSRLPGPSRDQPLMSLFKGGTLKLPVRYRYGSLLSKQASQFGLRPTEVEGYSFFPYDLPIGKKNLPLEWEEAAGGATSLGFLLRLELPEGRTPGQGGPLFTLSWMEKGEKRERVVSFHDVQVLGTTEGRMLRFFAPFEAGAGVHSCVLRKEGEPGRLQLEGISCKKGGAWEPLLLHFLSRAGVPTGIRGGHPEKAGRILLPGQSMKLQVPGDWGLGVTRVWAFLDAFEGPRFGETVEGTIVGRLRVGLEGGTFLNRDLRHQVQVFAGKRSANQELPRLLEGKGTKVGFEWEGTDEEPHVVPVVPIPLEGGRRILSLEYQNLGTYPQRVRDLVLAMVEKEELEGLSPFPLARAGGEGRFRLTSASQKVLGLGSWFLFRNGKLSASTLGKAGTLQRFPKKLEEIETDWVWRDGRNSFGKKAESFETFHRFKSPDWDGAVLAFSIEDPGWGRFLQMHQLIALLLGGVSLPWFLVLLFEVFAMGGGLRIQLSTTMAAATIVPLVVLSMFLANLLTKGQEENARKDLLDGLSQVERRIGESLNALETMGRKLHRLMASALARGESEESLRKSLSLVRPTDWPPESFLVLEWPGEDGKVKRVFDRPSSRKLGSVPLGPGAGLYLAWARSFLAARIDPTPPSGRARGAKAPSSPSEGLRLSLGRVVDPKLLSSWAERGTVALFDLKGYPLLAGSNPDALVGDERFLLGMRRPSLQKLLASVVGPLRGSLSPEIQSVPAPFGAELGSLKILRDPNQQAQFVLGFFEPARGARLPFFLGSLGVGPFFTAVLGLLLALVLFFAWMMTDRISRPIEALEGMASRLAMGDLEIDVSVEKGVGEVSKLTRSFSTMASELKRRMLQGERMSRTIHLLFQVVDPDEVAAQGARLMGEALGCAPGMVLVRDWAGKDVLVFGEEGGERRVSRQNPLVRLVFEAVGVFCFRREVLGTEGGWPLFAEAPLGLVLPLRNGERPWGAVVFPLHQGEACDLDLPHLEGLGQQLVAAFDRARLHHLAVEDPRTGFLVKPYFRKRLEGALDEALRNGETRFLIRVALEGSDHLRKRWGNSRFDLLLAQFAKGARKLLTRESLVGRTGLFRFEFLLESRGEDLVEAFRRAARLAALDVLDELSSKEFLAYLEVQGARFPEDGRSMAFLLDALGRRDEDLPSGRSRQPIVRGGYVFASKAMKAVLDDLDRISGTDFSLLVQGETGTGKEIIVDLCHQGSKRSGGPLVKVNCAAIPSSLIESELFGHEKGAFTGATQRKKGLFEAASGGSLFLDEVGELPLAVQAKLLRVLQNREFFRVGGTHPISVDVRVIAATHRDLTRDMKEGRFREDLYYRLQEFCLNLPPLRERKEEIPYLIDHFAAEYQGEAKTLSPGALDLLYRYDFPGNIRQLKNLLQRAFVLARGPFIEPEDLDLPPLQGPRLEEEEEKSEPAFVLPSLPPRDRPQGGVRGPSQGERWALLEKRLKEEGEISPQEYRTWLGISRRTATRDLGTWKEKGLLWSRGNKRSLRYGLGREKG
ncbi:MAG TPA: HAMP domain-containing protein [Planctomycetes bacterium]|nr:HAMP domain-containing protein [Planctomycetota bacterium]